MRGRRKGRVQSRNELNQFFIMGLNGYLIRIQFRAVYLTSKVVKQKRLLLGGRQKGRNGSVTFY